MGGKRVGVMFSRGRGGSGRGMVQTVFSEGEVEDYEYED